MSAGERWFRGFWALATFAVAAFILFESTRGAGDPAVPELTTAETYLGHAAVYAVLAFCAQSAFLSQRWVLGVATVVAAGLFGVAIEAYQSTLEGREGSVLDAAANLAGATFGAALAGWLTPAWRRWLGQPKV